MKFHFFVSAVVVAVTFASPICDGPRLECNLAPTIAYTNENTRSQVRGSVYFHESTRSGKCQIVISGRIEGLGDETPHGWHVHTTPDISSPDGTATGGHLNLEDSDHGLPDSAVHHTGDLGNM